MKTLCVACLCSDRNMYLLADTGLSNIYEQILNDISKMEYPSRLCMQICWECRAILRRFERFRLQAQGCYSVLLECLNQNPTSCPKPRPSKLIVEQVHTLSYPTVKVKVEILEEVKVEKEESDEINEQDQEVHNEPETFVHDLELADSAVINTKERNPKKREKKDQDKQPHKKKVKKKVKLKGKKKKPPQAEPEPQSEGVSDRDFDGAGDMDSVPEEKYEDEKPLDVNTEPAPEVPPLNGVKAKRGPRSKEVLPDKPTCPDCGKTFSSKKTYRYHRNVLHKGHNRYPCPRCGRVYQWKSNLGRHMRTHKAIDTGELYCEKCDKTFASVATYRQHLRISRRHVSESEFNFMCNECGKKFVDKTRLRDHIDWEHLKRVKYRCQICNNAFKCHTTLYVHMQNIHTNKEKKENLCHVCGKSYQNASKLKYHIVAMHTSETPHRCAQCGAAFGWYSSLYRHVREVHYGMKVPAKNVKKNKMLRELLIRPTENPPLAQAGPP